MDTTTFVPSMTSAPEPELYVPAFFTTTSGMIVMGAVIVMGLLCVVSIKIRQVFWWSLLGLLYFTQVTTTYSEIGHTYILSTFSGSSNELERFSCITECEESSPNNRCRVTRPIMLNISTTMFHCDVRYQTHCHYTDVIMSTMASQITSLTIVYSTVYSGTYERKHQSSASLAFVRGIHRWPVNAPHKGPVTWKMFPFDDVIMARRPLLTTGEVNHLFWTYILKMDIWYPVKW